MILPNKKSRGRAASELFSSSARLCAFCFSTRISSMSTMSLCHHDYKMAAVILDVSQALPYLPYKRQYFLMHFFLSWRNTFSTGPMSLLTRSHWPGRDHTLMLQMQKSLGMWNVCIQCLHSLQWELSFAITEGMEGYVCICGGKQGTAVG